MWEKLRIRFQRFGRRNKPFYRIVAAKNVYKRDGKFIEILGKFDPMLDKNNTRSALFNIERIKFWLALGAEPTDPVAKLLAKVGLLPPFYKQVALRRLGLRVVEYEEKYAQYQAELKEWEEKFSNLKSNEEANKSELI